MSISIEIRRKVFIRGVNWVGDAVMASAALHRLRKDFAGSHITLMVRPWVEAIYKNNPDIDELWVHDDSASMKSFFQAVKRVREAKFDLGIALPNSFRSALLMKLGKIPNRFGFARGNRSLLLTRKVKVKPQWLKEHEVYYYLHLVEWMLDLPPEPPQMVLNPGEEERAQIRQMARERGWEGKRPWIGIAPGSINSMAKRWLPERFAVVADRLAGEFNAQVFLLGSKEEKKVVDQVAGLCKSSVVNLGTELNLAQFIAFMERLDAFVGNDSGAMHVAAALGVPAVAIFGPTNWVTTAPFSSKSKIVRHPVECSPCMLRNCPIGHPCMKGVEVDHIFTALKELGGDIRSRMTLA
ncbi:lipopolysaccharide heptosyltransferase II [Candidatus Sumerlaeota bacterium]|nr:lipopolysaccharide heptosyltransferase II [Candidatus Sumerlaeota bacterium]